jgi:proline racemase
MPTRVITSGPGVLPGATMFDRMRYLASERDDLRTLLMYEPRGHAAMSGAILQPPARPDADVGVVFIEVSGCLPMCGHGTIGPVAALGAGPVVSAGRRPRGHPPLAGDDGLAGDRARPDSRDRRGRPDRRSRRDR